MNSTHFGKTALTILSLIAALLFSMIAVSCGDEGGGGETPLSKLSPDTPTPDNPTPSTDIFLETLIVPKDSNSGLRLDNDGYANIVDEENTVTLYLPNNVGEASYQNAKRQLTFNYQVYPSDTTLTFNGKNGNSGKVSNVDLQNGSDHNIVIRQGSKIRTYKVEVIEGTPAKTPVLLQSLSIKSPANSDAEIEEVVTDGNGTVTLLFLESNTYEEDIKKVTFGNFWTTPVSAHLYFNDTEVKANTTTVDCSVPSSKIEIRYGSLVRYYDVKIKKIAVDTTEYKINIDTTNNDEYKGTVSSPITFTKQKGATLPNLSVEGYSFKGYNTKKDGTGTKFEARNGSAYSAEGEYFNGTRLSSAFPENSTEVTLYAQWEGKYVQYTINTLFWYVPPKDGTKEKSDLNTLCFRKKIQLIGSDRDGTKSFKAGTTPSFDDIISKWGIRTIDYIDFFNISTQGDSYALDIMLSNYKDYILTPRTGTANYITIKDTEEAETKTLVAPAIPKVTGDGKAEFRLYVLGKETDFNSNYQGSNAVFKWEDSTNNGPTLSFDKSKSSNQQQ